MENNIFENSISLSENISDIPNSLKDKMGNYDDIDFLSQIDSEKNKEMILQNEQNEKIKEKLKKFGNYNLSKISEKNSYFEKSVFGERFENRKKKKKFMFPNLKIKKEMMRSDNLLEKKNEDELKLKIHKKFSEINYKKEEKDEEEEIFFRKKAKTIYKEKKFRIDCLNDINLEFEKNYNKKKNFKIEKKNFEKKNFNLEIKKNIFKGKNFNFEFEKKNFGEKNLEIKKNNLEITKNNLEITKNNLEITKNNFNLQIGNNNFENLSHFPSHIVNEKKTENIFENENNFENEIFYNKVFEKKKIRFEKKKESWNFSKDSNNINLDEIDNFKEQTNLNFENGSFKKINKNKKKILKKENLKNFEKKNFKNENNFFFLYEKKENEKFIIDKKKLYKENLYQKNFEEKQNLEDENIFDNNISKEKIIKNLKEEKNYSFIFSKKNSNPIIEKNLEKKNNYFEKNLKSQRNQKNLNEIDLKVFDIIKKKLDVKIKLELKNIPKKKKKKIFFDFQKKKKKKKYRKLY